MSILFQADNDPKRIIVDATLRREPADDRADAWLNLIAKIPF